MTTPSRPIVLCGSLRAGTTLLRLLLGQHSAIEGFGESDPLLDALPDDLARDPDALEAYKLKALDDRLLRRLSIRQLHGTTPEEVFAEIIGQHPLTRERLLLTFHRQFHRVDKFLPNAFFIHLQRDPRDVALSAVQMGWGGVPYHGVDVWMEAERDWQKAERHIDASRRTFIRYEDLVSDPRSELTRILEAAGLHFEDAVMTPEGSTYSAPSARPFEAFRKKMSATEIQELNSKLTWVGRDYGYNLTPATPPSAARLLRLKAEGRWRALSQRLERYGVPLVMREFVTRKLGMERARRAAREEIEAIIVEHLK